MFRSREHGCHLASADAPIDIATVAASLHYRTMASGSVPSTLTIKVGSSITVVTTRPHVIVDRD